jgi:SHS2 domain-containing protein
MKRFEYLDITTADVCFLAYGKDLNELFENSASAMFEVMVNTKQIKPEIKRTVEVKAEDRKSLLFDWLNELLVFYGSENLVFSEFKVKLNEKENKLMAYCYGEKINPKKHDLRTEVKAATYHQMKIEKVNGKWKAQVIVDI